MDDTTVNCAAAFAAATIIAATLTPLARRLAMASNLVAKVRPDRLSQEPRPYGGGLAIAATLAIMAAVAVTGGAQWIIGAMHGATVAAWLTADEIEAAMVLFGRLALGGLFFFVIGILDDCYSMSPWRKLFLQFVGAAMMVNIFDFRATIWPATDPTSVALNQAASILWIVAVINAYNMFDHADGLAAAVGVVMFGALAFSQALEFEWMVPLAAMAAAGALAGFLIYNFPPAKLFMGDAGSSLIGYLLAVLTLAARFDGRNLPEVFTSQHAALVGPALLAVPLFDMTCVIASRLVRRENPLRGDATSHLAHRMLARGWRPRAIVIFAAALAAMTGMAAVAIGGLRRGADTTATAPAAWAAALLVAMALSAMLIVRRRPRAETRP